MTDTRSQLDAARRRAHSLRLKLAGAQRQIDTTRKELNADIAEKKVVAYKRQLAETENEIENMAAKLAAEAFLLPIEVIESTFEHDVVLDDDLTIPDFLRRTS